QKAEENAISKSVAKEIYNAQVDEILKSLNDVDGVVTKQNERIGEVSNKVTDFEVKIDKYDGKFVSYDETINELEGKVTTSIEKVEGIGNKVEANTTEITKQAGMIAAKLDETTYTRDKDGMVKDIASNKAEIEATAKEVSSKVSRDEFDSLEIGGRNLLKGTSNKYQDASHSTYYASLAGKVLLSDLGLKVGDTITYSVYVKAHKDYGEKLRIRWHTADQTNHANSYGESSEEISKGNEGRIKMTPTVPKDTDNFYLCLTGNPTGTAFTSQFKELQLEKGTKATDWTPAPEDVDTRIDHAETEIKQNADEILLRETKDEENKERVKINKAQTDITANADAIKLRATTSQLDTEKKRITNAEGRIDVLDNAVKLKASQED